MTGALDLGPGWRTVYDAMRDAVVVLHMSGLWTEIDASALALMSPGEAQAVSAALRDGVGSVTGRVTVETTHTPATVSARVVA